MKNLLFALALVFGVTSGAAAQPADGSWEVRLPPAAMTGQLCESDALFRLTVAQGRLSGIFLGLGGTQTLPNLVLNPDGTFTGVTSGGTAPSGQPMHVLSVAGQFSGNTVTLKAVDTMGCGTRSAQATRTGG